MQDVLQYCTYCTLQIHFCQIRLSSTSSSLRPSWFQTLSNAASLRPQVTEPSLPADANLRLSLPWSQN